MARLLFWLCIVVFPFMPLLVNFVNPLVLYSLGLVPLYVVQLLIVVSYFQAASERQLMRYPAVHLVQALEMDPKLVALQERIHDPKDHASLAKDIVQFAGECYYLGREAERTINSKEDKL